MQAEFLTYHVYYAGPLIEYLSLAVFTHVNDLNTFWTLIIQLYFNTLKGAHPKKKKKRKEREKEDLPMKAGSLVVTLPLRFGFANFP